MIIGLLLIGLSEASQSTSMAAEHQRTEPGQGTTVDDLTRGLKSAAQRVEKEIPKIGSAIGEAFKKMAEKSPGRKPAQEPSQGKQ
jgi:hypothetical protein